MRTLATVMLLICPTAALSADRLPRFEDYPAIEQFSGRPSDPVLRLPVHRNYRTRLRRGVLFGEGLLGVSTPERPPKPNFAGAFYAIAWGCGSDGCAALAVVDARTGAIYGPPPNSDPTRDNFIATPRTTGCTGIGVRSDSRLLFVEKTVWNGEKAKCERAYYEWQDAHYRPILKTNLPATE